MLNKDFYLKFLIFSFLVFLLFESAISSDFKEKTEKYPKEEVEEQTNKEKGWRWRYSLNFTYQDFKSLPDNSQNLPLDAFFNVDSYHNLLAEQEYMISHSISKEQKKGRINVLIPAISILLKTKDNQWKIIGDCLKFPSETSFIVFLSGNAPKKDKKNFSYFTENAYQYLQLYHFLSGTNLSLSYSSLDKDLRNILKNSTFKIPSRIDHSEQYLHIFLNTTQYLLDNVERILNQRNISKEDTIHLIILHLHSRIDICSDCTQSLYWLSKSPDGCVSQMKKKLKKIYNTPDNKKEDGGIKFLILASSREVYGSENLRMKNGHDGHYYDIINGNSFPPHFAIKAIEPFLHSELATSKEKNYYLPSPDNK